MIAPTNCNPDCDCAQRMVRCQRAAEVDCIEAVSRTVQPHQVELRKQLSDPWSDCVSRYWQFKRQCLVKAFRECKLDCSDWHDDCLRELADIAIRALEGGSS